MARHTVIAGRPVPVHKPRTAPSFWEELLAVAALVLLVVLAIGVLHVG